uniref:Uncharacterized protein n=1 Tax=viral metagenome TaxID=1070528 RepID=A0A6C0M2L8_9ZZZZ
MSDVDHYTADKMQKVFRGLYADMYSAFSKCATVNEPAIKPVDSWTKLPLPEDLRRALSSGKSIETDYFPDEIQRHILNEPGVAVTYKFSVGSRNVALHFTEFNVNVNQMDLKKMQAHARRVCALMHLVSMHASREMCSSDLNIFIYMTEFKKRFPEKPGETLDTEHANTGMAYHCAKNNDIIVYRKEEWFKVLIHESFHAFGLSFIEHDLSNGVNQGMQGMLQKMYAISHPVRIYETYCEIWARILNVVFNCFADENATPVHNNEIIRPEEFQVFMECVMDGIETNAGFSQQQYAKLLRYADISHETLTQPTEENRAIVREKYRENTNVFAYTVLTCALMHSPHDFMVWCYKNNPFQEDKRGIMQFRTIPSNFNSFILLLDHCKRRCPKPAHQYQLTDVMGSSMRMTPPITKHE